MAFGEKLTTLSSPMNTGLKNPTRAATARGLDQLR